MIPFYLIFAVALFTDAFRNAPAESASLVNPYAGDAQAVAAGGKLFRMHCDKCHGTQGSGSRFAPSLRSSSVGEAPPGALFWFLTNGELTRGMPSFARLTEERRWQLVSYLHSLGATQRELTPPLARTGRRRKEGGIPERPCTSSQG